MSLEFRKASDAYFRMLSSLFSSHHLPVYPVSAKWKPISAALCYCGSDPFTTVGSEVTCVQSPGWVSGASCCDASLLVKQACASRDPLLLALVFLWWRIPEGGRKHPRMLNAVAGQRMLGTGFELSCLLGGLRSVEGRLILTAPTLLHCSLVPQSEK